MAFGHRRLAIIDLSPGGAQPMTDASGRWTITFNGEIYNYRELREELIGHGVTFRSRSDTEVILEAFRRWGTDSFGRFNGMFAFALWDHERRELWLVRDRFGKKPLYFAEQPGGVAFASELKALCLRPGFSRRLNARAISQFLSLNYTLTDDVIFEGVHKLKPGHYLRWTAAGKEAQRPFWNLADAFRRRTEYRSADEAAEALRGLLDDAVRLRLVSDVPVGVFLSGGVDSSTVAASMCQTSPAVRSFSVGFREETFSELAEAREIAAYLGVTHTDSVVEADAAALLPIMAAQADEPFADTSLIPTYLLSKFAREHVTVCLSGDGGDEVFAGYETYAADKIHHWLRHVPTAVQAAGGAAVNAVVPTSFGKVSLDYKLRQFAGARGFSSDRAHYHWRSIFSRAEQRELLQPDWWARVSAHDPLTVFEAADHDVADLDYLTRGLYVDMKTWLADDILVKADRASMAHGLEVRSPFLDHRVVEFAAALPMSWKMHGFQKKYVLRKSQSTRLPAHVLGRRKQGFNAPIAHWLMTSLRAHVDRLLTQDSSIFQPAFIRRLWTEHLEQRRDNSHKLFGLITFQLWSDRYCPSLT